MSARSIALALVTLLAISGLVAQVKQKPIAVSFGSGFLNGNDFRELTEAEQNTYIIGTHDGFEASTLFGAPKARHNALDHCLPELTGAQFTAIVNKYMKDHPERWGDPMNLIVYSSPPVNCLKEQLR